MDNAQCKVCEQPTLLKASCLCNLCSTLIASLAGYSWEARNRLETIIIEERGEE